MAKLDRYGADEGKSAEMATEWSISTALDVSSGAVAEKALNEQTQYIGLWVDVDCYFRFDTETGDTNSASNDLRLAKNKLIRLKVPRGLGDQGDTVYFHIKPIDSESNKECRLVEE